MNRLTRVLIASNQPVVSTGIMTLLETYVGPEGQKVFNCRILPTDLHALEVSVPLVDIFLWDTPDLPSTLRLDQVRQMAPAMKMIALIPSADNALIESCLSRGASGVFLTTSRPYKLIGAIQHVIRGGVFIDGRSAASYLQRLQKLARKIGQTSPVLSEIERKILTALSRGASYDQVADDLFLSKSGVRYHLRRVYRKLNVSGHSAAIRSAISAGVVLDTVPNA